jgi:hypothetical protein
MRSLAPPLLATSSASRAQPACGSDITSPGSLIVYRISFFQNSKTQNEVTKALFVLPLKLLRDCNDLLRPFAKAAWG